MKTLLKELVKIATKCDEAGLHKEAGELDDIIIKLSQQKPIQDPQSKLWFVMEKGRLGENKRRYVDAPEQNMIESFMWPHEEPEPPSYSEQAQKALKTVQDKTETATESLRPDWSPRERVLKGLN
jgi:hypothetical protein